MLIAIIIAGGVVAISVVASVFDYLGKKNKGAGAEITAKVRELEKKVAILESTLDDKTEKIGKLESDVNFMNKLLEKKD